MTTLRIASLSLLAVAAFGATNYSYDAAGRLTKVDYGGGKTLTYTYDNAGNLLSRISTSASVTPTNKKKLPEQKTAEKKNKAPEPAASNRQQ